MQTSMPMLRPGLVRRAWVRLAGESDPIERQLAATAKEGATLARVAHLCAFLMLLLFSLGSLVALAGDSVQAIASGHVTFPALIAAGVSTLLVACMDTGMLYAASMLRLLATRRAEQTEGRLHRFVLFSVAILEAATYAYMSYRYETPHDGIAWALIAARALAAPLLSVYLALARPLPVTARDMLALAERIAGEGVLRDLAAIAGDTSAPLAEKVSLYIAAAVIASPDRARLDALLEVAQRRELAAHSVQDSPRIVEAMPAPSQRVTVPSRPPTGGGTPVSASKRNTVGRKGIAGASGTAGGAKVVPLRSLPAEERIRRAVAQYPTISVRTLAKRANVSQASASKWLQVIAAERSQAVQ